MDWSDFMKAFNQANDVIYKADKHVNDMAGVIAGRLQSSSVSSYTLVKLKKELEDFNMHTKCWKDK